jgi:outer membrane protein assembly factor BamB
MNPDGTVKWKAVLQGSLKNASPALSHDEATLFVSIKTQAIALDTETGLEKWRVEIADKGLGSLSPNYAAVVSNDGAAVYFPSKEGLWALDPETGAAIWKFVPLNGELLKSAPVLGADGTIYVGASKKKSSHFYAIDPADGGVVWSHEHTTKGQFVNSQAAVGADGTVYVGFGDTLFAFDGAGNGMGGSLVLWQMALPGRFDSGVVLGGEGVLYIGVGKSLFKITD